MQTATDKHVIVGLGKTGLSCARYLHRKGVPFSVMDTRRAPPGLDDFKREFPQARVVLGRLDAGELAAARVLVMSPGVDPRLEEIRQAAGSGVRFTGDIDLFARETQAPIVAITGSNAKSTVTTMVGEMAGEAGLRAAVAGNIGTPVLDLLREQEYQLYVLELSSFQLETTSMLGAEVASVLNISEDHLDRYDSLEAYRQAKHRIFEGCRKVVVNRDDPLTVPRETRSAEVHSFGLRPSEDENAWYVLNVNGEEHLAFAGEALLPVSALQVAGRHNVANALAALALGHAAGFSREAMLKALKKFRGLRHRCQEVARIGGIAWYNDSKGTNVGAAVAAIAGLGKQGRIILLAGGEGKGADFAPLAPAMRQYGRVAILFGRDAELIASVLCEVVRVERAASLEEAVGLARRLAQPGEQVLLSPACASFDMFDNYEHRGEVFEQAVEALH